MWRIAGMAFMMAAEVAAGAGIGWLIDYWAGTQGRWVLIGGIAGIIVGMTSFLRAAFQMSRSTPPVKRRPHHLIQPQTWDDDESNDDTE